MDSDPKIEIKIFGSHCRRCQTFKELITKIVQDLHLAAEIECLGQPEDFLRFNVMYLPALAINGRLLVQGGFLSPKKLKKLIQEAIS